MHSRFIHLIFGTTATMAAIATTLLPAQAVIRFGSPDQKYIAPTGEYASIPWGTVAFRTFGTSKPAAWPISPNWALRAKHLAGGVVGYDVDQNGTLHNVVQSVQVAGTDLELIRVTQPFSSYFHMYNGGDEIGKELVMFGPSNQIKAAPVFSEGTGRFNGWLPGGLPIPPGPGESTLLNWGRNKVTGFVDVFGTETIYTTFDAPTLLGGAPNPDSLGDDEAIGFNGDSSGAFFIQQAGEWRLAGVIYAVDATYFKQADTNVTLGAIFDARDLWQDVPVDPNFPNGPKVRVRITGDDPNTAAIEDNPVPFGTYASRVSTYRGSIDTITGQTFGLGPVLVPESGTGQLVVLGVGSALLGLGIVRRRRVA